MEIDFTEAIEKISTNEKKLKQKDYLSEGNFPVIDQGQAFIGGYTNDASRLIKGQGSVIVFGDHTRIVKLVPFDFVPGADGVKVIKPRAFYNPRLFSFFMSVLAQMIPNKGYARHFQHLEATKIPFPSYKEQEHIVEKIEEMFSDLDNAIENLKKAQEQLRVYRQAVLKSAFDGGLLPQQNKWKYLPFSEVCQFNPSKSESKEISDDTEVSFLPMPCVSENGKILKQEIRRYGDVKKGYTYFREKDVLLAKITPCFENGKKAIAHDLINGIGFGSTEFHVLRPKDEVVSKWILLAISQEAFRNQAIMQMTGAVGQKRVPQRVVEEYKIPIPLKEEQNKIVQEVESRFSVCDNLEETIESSLKQAESLRQSILKQAFEGKLTEQWRKEHKDLISGENSAESLLKKIKAEKEALQVKPKGKKEVIE